MRRVGLDSNDLSDTTLETPIDTDLVIDFSAEVRDKHDIDDVTVLVDEPASLQRACRKHGLNCRRERHERRNSGKYNMIYNMLKL